MSKLGLRGSDNGKIYNDVRPFLTPEKQQELTTRVNLCTHQSNLAVDVDPFRSKHV